MKSSLDILLTMVVVFSVAIFIPFELSVLARYVSLCIQISRYLGLGI